jgi:hypothetical protein
MSALDFFWPKNLGGHPFSVRYRVVFGKSMMIDVKKMANVNIGVNLVPLSGGHSIARGFSFSLCYVECVLGRLMGWQGVRRGGEEDDYKFTD